MEHVMGTRVRVRLLYVFLGLATAFVVVSSVGPAVVAYGTSGVLANVPFLGAQPVPALEVIPGEGFAERWEATGPSEGIPGQRDLFPWTDTSEGAVDAATGRAPVELAIGAGGMKLTLWGSLGWADRLSLALPPLAWPALALAVLGLLWRIVRTVSSGEVFTRANARRLTVIGLLIALGSSVLQLGAYWLDRDVIARSAAAGVLDVPFTFSFVPLWVGAVVVLLAEVFHQGVRLRAEVEGLV
jgi:hypothetical protein